MKIIDTDEAEDREEMRKAAQKVSIKKAGVKQAKLTRPQQAALYYARQRRRRRGGPPPN
jgi:hypothetical protein